MSMARPSALLMRMAASAATSPESARGNERSRANVASALRARGWGIGWAKAYREGSTTLRPAELFEPSARSVSRPVAVGSGQPPTAGGTVSAVPERARRGLLRTALHVLRTEPHRLRAEELGPRGGRGGARRRAPGGRAPEG